MCDGDADLVVHGSSNGLKLPYRTGNIVVQ